MKDRNWLDRQLEGTRVTVASWSERKKAALKAQISGEREIVNKVAALALLKSAVASLESGDLYGAAQFIDAALTQVKILRGDAR